MASRKQARNKANVNAATITRQSKSNLALAFVSLDRERKRDMTVFYAFCRVIDDIVDTTESTATEKERGLNNWRRWLRSYEQGEPELARDIRLLMEKYKLPPEMFEQII